ncbi:MAG: hypothetical protein BGO55_12070 [Sphingobacteriales bacterium 50-39]|nr:MAG: hypothetical protein BGO55_12070 [Sphingobacteriales bacterium 50-39]
MTLKVIYNGKYVFYSSIFLIVEINKGGRKMSLVDSKIVAKPTLRPLKRHYGRSNAKDQIRFNIVHGKLLLG